MPISASRLVILDRDGVINRDSEAYIKSVEEWIPYPQAINAIGRLSRAGWTVAVATNQSGIARGYYSEKTLQAMHRRLLDLVHGVGGNIAAIAYCPHGPDDDCDCRKPKAGLLEQIRRRCDLPDLAGAWMVGDSLRDLQAGMTAGCHTALVRTGKGAQTETRHSESLQGVPVFDDLDGFSDWLLQR